MRQEVDIAAVIQNFPGKYFSTKYQVTRISRLRKISEGINRECILWRIEQNVSSVGTRPLLPFFRSLLLNFLPPLDRPRPLLLCFSALTLLLAWAGCNRFPEARAHYRPVGLAITCEASFDFVCASQHSFRLSTRPSEILPGSFERRTERKREVNRRRENGKQRISRDTAVCFDVAAVVASRNGQRYYNLNRDYDDKRPMIITGRASSAR